MPSSNVLKPQAAFIRTISVLIFGLFVLVSAQSSIDAQLSTLYGSFWIPNGYVILHHTIKFQNTYPSNYYTGLFQRNLTGRDEDDLGTFAIQLPFTYKSTTRAYVQVSNQAPCSGVQDSLYVPEKCQYTELFRQDVGIIYPFDIPPLTAQYAAKIRYRDAFAHLYSGDRFYNIQLLHLYFYFPAVESEIVSDQSSFGAFRSSFIAADTYPDNDLQFNVATSSIELPSSNVNSALPTMTAQIGIVGPSVFNFQVFFNDMTPTSSIYVSITNPLPHQLFRLASVPIGLNCVVESSQEIDQSLWKVQLLGNEENYGFFTVAIFPDLATPLPHSISISCLGLEIEYEYYFPSFQTTPLVQIQPTEQPTPNSADSFDVASILAFLMQHPQPEPSKNMQTVDPTGLKPIENVTVTFAGSSAAAKVTKATKATKTMKSVQHSDEIAETEGMEEIQEIEKGGEMNTLAVSNPSDYLRFMLDYSYASEQNATPMTFITRIGTDRPQINADSVTELSIRSPTSSASRGSTSSTTIIIIVCCVIGGVVLFALWVLFFYKCIVSPTRKDKLERVKSGKVSQPRSPFLSY